MRNAHAFLIAILLSACASKRVVEPPPVEPHVAILESTARIEADPEFVDVARYVEGVQVLFDLRYASERNFLGRDLYGPLRACYLHLQAADKLQRAAENLERDYPGYRLIVFDCLRPRIVQELLWNEVKGTTKEKYVANPEKGSVHNYGFAIDLGVIDDNGLPLNMGSDFDDFSETSEPRREEKLLAEGKLSDTQVANRRILRSAMEAAGFIQLPTEWWHYDALAPDQVRSRYKIVE